MKNGLFAVINIGTSAFRLEIGSFEKGQYKQLEYLIKSLSLGKDTFSKGYISSQSIETACDILNKFRLKMKEYGIKNRFKAIATSGVREAKNREFFIDYMLKKASVDVEVLTPHEELYIRYIGIKNEFKNFSRFEKKGIALVNVSSGNVSVIIVKNRSIMYADSLHFGSLRLNEMFKHVDSKHKIYAYRRYIDNMLDKIRETVSNFEIKNIVFAGSSINILNRIFSTDKNSLKKSDIRRLFDSLKYEDCDYIKKSFKIRENEAEVLKPTLSIYLSVLSLFGLDGFYFSRTTFPNKLLMHYSKSYKMCSLNDYLEDTILAIGDKYDFDKKHALCVKNSAEKLFDELKDIHLLDKKYKKLLEIAALLHDVGYFINAETHERHSYYIIRSMRLPQISDADNKLVSLTALLHKAQEIDPYIKMHDYLSEEEMFILMKLASLLRIADALDASHRQLVEGFDVLKMGSNITIRIKSSKYTYFEELSLKKKSELFTNVFGIKINVERAV